MKINYCKAKYRFAISKTLNTALNFLGQPSKQMEMSITFVDEIAIKQLNAEQRNVDSVTDVLSFPTIENTERGVIDLDKFSFDVDAESGRLFLGDIVVCLKRAKEQAVSYGHSLKREICFLCLHGLLHLLGYDHMNESDENQMFGLQEKILNKVGITRD